MPNPRCTPVRIQNLFESLTFVLTAFCRLVYTLAQSDQMLKYPVFQQCFLKLLSDDSMESSFLVHERDMQFLIVFSCLFCQLSYCKRSICTDFILTEAHFNTVKMWLHKYAQPLYQNSAENVAQEGDAFVFLYFIQYLLLAFVFITGTINLFLLSAVNSCLFKIRLNSLCSYFILT